MNTKPKIVDDGKVNMIFYDIEMMPNLVRTWQKYEQTVIWYERYAYMWSISFKERGKKKITHKNITDFPLYKKDKYSDEALVKYTWEILNNADITVAHNGDSFDDKVLNGRFAHYGLTPPKPRKTVDTKKVYKYAFRDDSNSLKDICMKHNLPHKKETGGYDLWRECENGNQKAIKKMAWYNNGDITSLEAVYDFVLPYINNHPNLALMNEKRIACPNCGSENMQKRGNALTRTAIKQRWQCQDCGSWHSSALKEGSQIS